MNNLDAKHHEEVRRILNKYPAAKKQSAVMPLLFLAQRYDGHISQQAIRDIAELLDITPTEVGSIVGFYSLFHAEPGGRYRLQVCTDLPCALRGADQFLKELCEYLGVAVGETTADGLFTVEEVKCLAACHRAPVFQVQGDGHIAYHENQTMETVKAFIEEIRDQSKELAAEKEKGS